jgi:ribosomal protein L40E
MTAADTVLARLQTRIDRALNPRAPEPDTALHTRSSASAVRLNTLRREAQRAIDRIDRALGTRSMCGRCRAPITTSALRCNACGYDFLAVKHRSAPRLGTPIEYSHHAGTILSIR